MDENFDIQAYMTRGVEKTVADSLKATLKDPNYHTDAHYFRE